MDWIFLQTNTFNIYLVISFLLISGAFGFPIPEDLPLVVSGILIHRGNVKIEIIFLVCYFSIIIGDLIIYKIGEKFGNKLFKSKFFTKKLSEEKLQKIGSGIDRHSFWMIFLARHLFYFRTVTFLGCGAFKMNFVKFLVFDAIAALISVPILISFGYFLAENLPFLFEMLDRAKTISLIILGIGIVSFLVILNLYKSKNKHT